LQVRLRAVPEKDEYKIGEEIMLTVDLFQGGEIIPREVYEDYYTVNWAEFGSAFNGGFERPFALPERGTFIYGATVSGEGYSIRTNEITLNVENTPPIFNQNIEQRVYLLPFSQNTARIDLSAGATDTLGRELRYEVLSSAFNENEFEIDVTELVMNSYSLSKGSLTIRATDPLGGFVDFEVFVNTVNVTMWTIILIGGGGLIALAVLAVIAWLNLNKRFYGTCYVRFYDNESGEYFEEITITNPKRGKRRIPQKISDGGNLDFDLHKCRIQASGKRHVFFKTKEAVFGHGIRGKKFKIDGDGNEVQISRRADSDRGIIVRFESNKRR
jgi:hypothetical protein